MLVVFDVDDTLVDHSGAASQAALLLIRRYGAILPYTEDEFVGLWHAAADRHFAAYNAGECSYQEQRRRRIRDFFGGDLTDQEADSLFAVYLAGYERFWALFPDVLPCLDALDGRRLAIISNNHSEPTRLKLARTGIEQRFEDLVTPDVAGVSKPDAGIFDTLCARRGVDPAACVYVGDKLESDAGAAQAAGWRGIWLDRGGTGTPPGDGITTIHDLGALPCLLTNGRSSC